MLSAYTLKKRRLAIVLLDIVGSTAFVQKVGAVNAARVLQLHDRLARSACYRHNGREIDRSDGFLMSFDNVQDAILFALDYGKKVTPRVKLKSRIGIHWGMLVEVEQNEVFVSAGAKRVELEGIAKNIAARTMSLAEPEQILLTSDAYSALRSSVKLRLPKDVRAVCVGFYRFKGVAHAQQIYAISDRHELLQPPKGNEKVTRLGGPSYIKKLKRDRVLKDYLYSIWRLLRIAGTIYALFILYLLLGSRDMLVFLGLYEWLWWSPYVITYLEKMLDLFTRALLS